LAKTNVGIKSFTISADARPRILNNGWSDSNTTRLA
jgi:hypothetical protein